MRRFARPVAAASAKRAAPPQTAASQPRRAGPQRGPIWHAIQLKAAQTAAPGAAPQSRGVSSLPARLQAGIERLSGVAMDDVRVHRNSPEPAKFGALAFASGGNIHLGPGQERHLPHEAWHIVQQKQGRVRPTLQAKGVGINEDSALEREADLFGERALAMEPARGAQPAAHRAAAAPSGGAVQMKRLTPTEDVAAVNAANIVYFSGGAKSVSIRWDAPLIEKPRRSDLLKAICAKAAKVGADTSAEAGNNWNFNPDDAEKQNVNFFDPVRVRFAGRYKLNQASKNLVLDYHFGNRWSGYVIHVTDTGRNIDKKMHDPDSQVLMGQGEYSNVHDFNENDPTTVEATAGADAVTKIAGEGARWPVVAAHADTIRDGSCIFTNQTSNGDLTTKVRYITFVTLWSSWAATFGKAYGIANQDIAEKLKANNVQIGTGDNVQNYAVGTCESSEMTHGQDIAVDSPPPASDAGLAAVKSGVLRYKKSISVPESRGTHAEEVRAATDAVTATAGDGAVKKAAYVGADKFAFICTWSGNATPAAAGYTNQQGEGVRYEVPAYRAAIAEAKAGEHGHAPAPQSGKSTFIQERKAKYDQQAAVLAQALAAHIQTKAIQDLDAARVVASAFPLEDDEPIPAELTGLWTEKKLGDLAQAYLTRRAAKRKAAVEDKMKKFSHLKLGDQNKEKRKIKDQVERDIK